MFKVVSVLSNTNVHVNDKFTLSPLAFVNGETYTSIEEFVASTTGRFNTCTIFGDTTEFNIGTFCGHTFSKEGIIYKLTGANSRKRFILIYEITP
jgi:hypothetical protein